MLDPLTIYLLGQGAVSLGSAALNRREATKAQRRHRKQDAMSRLIGGLNPQAAAGPMGPEPQVPGVLGSVAQAVDPLLQHLLRQKLGAKETAAADAAGSRIQSQLNSLPALASQNISTALARQRPVRSQRLPLRRGRYGR